MARVDSIQAVEFVGVDFGHAESAVAVIRANTKSLPKVLECQGSKSIVTAVAKYKNGRTLIGEQALLGVDPSTQIWTGFKSQELADGNVQKPTQLFIGELIEELQKSKLISGSRNVRFYVGCPASWKADARESFVRLLSELQLEDVVVVPESRAAFLSLRESGELTVSQELLTETVLVIDLGSSTTDFTIVSKLREQPIDFGDNQLGSSLIDKAILKHLVSKHEKAEDLQKAFAEAPYYLVVCELQCRKAKEKYFASAMPPDNSFEIKALGNRLINIKSGLYFGAEITEKDMCIVLNQELSELGGRTWIDAYRDRLHDVRDFIQKELGTLPSLVILTGGPSRMSFALEICEQTFPAPTIVCRGREPEFAIATGLALTGRVDENIRQFREDAHTLLDSLAIHRVVEQHIDDLVRSMADLIVEKLIYEFFSRELELWRRGETDTLRVVSVHVNDCLRTWLGTTQSTIQLRELVSDWFRQVSPRIEQLTDPICDKYGVLSSAFSVPDASFIADGFLSENRNLMSTIYDDVIRRIAVIFPVLITGVLTMTTASLTIGKGALFGAILFFASTYLREKSKNIVLNTELPGILRSILSYGGITRGLQGQRDKLVNEIVKIFLANHKRYDLIESLVKPIKIKFEYEAERASLLIR